MKTTYAKFKDLMMAMKPDKKFFEDYINYADNTLANEFCQHLFEMELQKVGQEEDIPQTEERIKELGEEYEELQKQIEALPEDAPATERAKLEEVSKRTMKTYKALLSKVSTIKAQGDMLADKINFFDRQIEINTQRKALLQELINELA